MIVPPWRTSKENAMTESEFLDKIEAHRHEFYRYVLRNVWNNSVAEDVFSSAVIAAYRQLSKFRDGTNFRAWIFKILTNKCFIANREIKRLSVDIDVIDEQLLSTDERTKQAVYGDPEWFLEQCGDEVHRALAQLSTAQRSCLLLLTFEKYSYKEIAAILEIPIGTVMTHLSRGRKKLKHILFEYAQKEGIMTIKGEMDSSKHVYRRST